MLLDEVHLTLSTLSASEAASIASKAVNLHTSVLIVWEFPAGIALYVLLPVVIPFIASLTQAELAFQMLAAANVCSFVAPLLSCNVNLISGLVEADEVLYAYSKGLYPVIVVLSMPE